MFKSVYVKYIVTFMLIIILSLTLLIVIVGTIVGNYSEQAKRDTVRTVSLALADNFGDALRRRSIQDLNYYCSLYTGDVTALLETVETTGSAELTILVSDNGGKILLSYSGSGQTLPAGTGIPRGIMDELNNGVELSRNDTLDGILSDPHFVHAVPVFLSDNYVCGTVFVCSSSDTLDPFVEVLIKTVVITSLWVTLAALIAIYFTSERIIRPLKNISQAAKDFAAGHFDVRVPVTGRDEVAELAQAFNNMAQSLQALDEMRNNFMSSVSHDMRTPMTTISGFIDCILDGAIPPEKHEYYLHVIRDEIQRLSRLVASLLDISRIQAGDRKFVMAPFDICEMARQVLISFEQKIDKKRLEVEFEVDEDNMWVSGDHDAIYQILYNICDNAVKFARESGVLRLSVVKNDKKARISVYNEGDGIPYEDQPYIFERFFKSDKSRGKDKTGVGLGMFIAKTIIEAHHEELKLNSEPGRFCEFYFTLPLTAPDKTRAAAERSEKGNK